MATENREITLKIDGFKPGFVIGGMWYVVDKTSGKELFKTAKETNQKRLNNVFSGAAILETGNMNEKCAYGMFHNPGKGDVSLAQCLALAIAKGITDDVERLNREFVYFFTLTDENGENYVWILIVNNGVVQSGGDEIVGIEKSWGLKTKYKEDDYPEAQFEILDEPKASLQRIAELLGSLTKQEIRNAAIRNFVGQRKRIIRLSVLLAVLSVGSFVALDWWQQQAEEQRLAEEKLRFEQQAARRLESMKKSEFPPVWLNEPSPKNVLFTVERRLSQTPLSINGWSLVGFQYAKGEFSAAYARRGNDPYLPPPGKLNAKSGSSIVKWKGSVPKGSRIQGIMRKASAEDWLMQMSVGRPWKLTWKAEKRPSKNVTIGSSSVTILAAYQIYDVTVSETKAFGGLAELLDVPGFVISSVTWGPKGWTIKGQLYVLA